ncbi:hypothetical protein JGU71_13990 [Antrihabitans sp. YC3-6]|uniref:Uncharacterized protein n=1 Tax=Antrihabitans stalagmiti TaxID=2799499 RepID=A0A934NRC6_9NOCA|nr:hypothetical protein [Antrihabitans stalagmiti]MBJ8340003.1 hypothetical protein [Antrihabitans stalagmiti]
MAYAYMDAILEQPEIRTENYPNEPDRARISVRYASLVVHLSLTEATELAAALALALTAVDTSEART